MSDPRPGAVYTQDINRALRVSSKVRGGTIGINCTSVVGPQVPMGGFGSSGTGRELGEYALRHYTETKTMFVKHEIRCMIGMADVGWLSCV